jgi:ABC-type antimicrobial peptide transport system permease subunit
VGASDPATYLTVPMVLFVVTLIAAAAPARRALRLDPNVVLRNE